MLIDSDKIIAKLNSYQESINLSECSEWEHGWRKGIRKAALLIKEESREGVSLDKELVSKIKDVLTVFRLSSKDETPVTGKDVKDFIEKCIDSRMNLYLNSNKEAKYTKAILHPAPEELKKPDETVYVIEPCTMFGKPYYSVIADGQAMKVPAERIEFPE